MKTFKLSQEKINLSGINYEKDIPTITCKTNAGKTFFAIHELPHLIQEQTGKKIRNVHLYVPTKALKNQTLEAYKNLTEALTVEDLATNYTDLRDEAPKEKIKVGCFSALASYLAENDRINNPDLVIIDEADELIQWSLCHDNNMKAWDYLNSHKGEIIIVAMTATPQLLTRYVSRYSDYNFIDVTPNSPFNLRSEKITVVKHHSLDSYLDYFLTNQHSKTLCYIRSARKCLQLTRKLQDQGINAGFIVSKYNNDFIKDEGKEINALMADQLYNDEEGNSLELFDYISQYESLPKELEVLFINDSAVAGVNIHDEEVKSVIADTVELSTAIQASGRIRHDLKQFSIIFNFKELKDFKEDREKLYKLINGESKEAYYKQQTEYIKKLKDYRNKKVKDKPASVPLLTYKDSNNRIKVNPFAYAVYAYKENIYRYLKNDDLCYWYYEPLERMTDNQIEFYTGKEIRQATHNIKALENFNIEPYLNSKLFKEDKKKLIDEIKLLRADYKSAKWNSVKAILEAEGYTIKESMTRINGKNKRYSLIQG